MDNDVSFSSNKIDVVKIIVFVFIYLPLSAESIKKSVWPLYENKKEQQLFINFGNHWLPYIMYVVL